MRAFIDELARNARNELSRRHGPLFLQATGLLGITHTEAWDRLCGLATDTELTEEDRVYAEKKMAELAGK